MSEYNALPYEEKAPAPTELFPHRVPYAMAYVRMQEWEPPFCALDALANGAAFRSLVKPFRGREGAR